MSNIRAMDDVETRTVLTLRTGTKICVLVGLAFIALAVYFFVVPITSVRTTTGAVFGCGTAMSPAHGSFADGVCWRIADTNRYRAFLTLAIGVVTIIVGALMFGFDRREEQRQIPRDDRHRDADEPGNRRRDQDWADDVPPSRQDRFGDERGDHADADRRRPYEQPTQRAGRRYDDPLHDKDDERSSRPRDNRYDDGDDERIPRRSTPDKH